MKGKCLIVLAFFFLSIQAKSEKDSLSSNYKFYVQAGLAEDGAPWQNYLFKVGCKVLTLGNSKFYITSHYYHDFDRIGESLAYSSKEEKTSNGSLNYSRSISMNSHSEIMVGFKLNRIFTNKLDWVKFDAGLNIGSVFIKGVDRTHITNFDSTNSINDRYTYSEVLIPFNQKGTYVRKFQTRINIGVALEITKRVEVCLSSYIGLRDLVRPGNYSRIYRYEPFNYATLGVRYKFFKEP